MRKAEFRPIWIVAALPAVLMAAQRGVLLYKFAFSPEPVILEPLSECIALLVSLALLFVMISVKRIIAHYSQVLTRQRVAVDQAQIADRRKNQFLANMSHDLRTPLNAIIGFSEMMENQMWGRIKNLKYEGYITDINNSAHHLLAMINDLLDVSRLSAGRMALEEDNFRLSETIDHSVTVLRQAAEEKSISITFEAGFEKLAVRADKTRVIQIFNNLLSNAITYSPPDSTIQILWTIDQKGLSISVSDDGPGISPQVLKRIFTPFERTSTAMTTNKGGMGLGLFISKQLADMHEGDLTLDSSLGAGTKATLTLPRKRINLKDATLRTALIDEDSSDTVRLAS